MSEFEEWYNRNFCRENGFSERYLQKVKMHKHELRLAWNAALEKVSEELEIHDTMGDIKYEVNKRLRA